MGWTKLEPRCVCFKSALAVEGEVMPFKSLTCCENERQLYYFTDKHANFWLKGSRFFSYFLQLLLTETWSRSKTAVKIICKNWFVGELHQIWSQQILQWLIFCISPNAAGKKRWCMCCLGFMEPTAGPTSNLKWRFSRLILLNFLKRWTD